jgi:hypothetical protein
VAKVALCFAGLPRLSAISNQSWHRLIAQHDTDVFVHTWADDIPHIQTVRQDISAAFDPRVAHIELRRDFDTSLYTDRIWAYRSDPKNVISMWYSIAQSIGLADEYARQHGIEYDYVCRARFDWWCERFSLEPFDGLTVPDDPGLGGHNFTHRGIWYVAHNDQFGYGSMYVMRDYAETFHRIPWLYDNDGVDFCSELLLTTNMLTKKIPVRLQKGMRYRMVRT